MPKNRLALFSFVSMTLLLGMAALGVGGLGVFFARPEFVVLTCICYLFCVAATFTAANISPGVREDRGNRWVLVVLAGLTAMIGFVPPITDRIGFFGVGGDDVRWVGVVLFGAGCALRIWPVFALGNRFSGLVAIQPGHTLVTSGIYRFIRNPSYLGVFVLVIGWSLVFRSGVGVLLAASLMIPLVPRMRSEEALLASEFGAEYEAYRAHTWRLVPWVY